MITGIGIDLVRVSRFEHWYAKPGLVERYFHPDEIVELMAKGPGRILSLAARFAAKEAFGKALGTGLSGINLRHILVRNDGAGKPSVFVEETALEALKKSGGRTIHLSLSHETDHAVAMVVIEK